MVQGFKPGMKLPSGKEGMQWITPLLVVFAAVQGASSWSQSWSSWQVRLLLKLSEQAQLALRCCAFHSCLWLKCVACHTVGHNPHDTCSVKLWPDWDFRAEHQTDQQIN